MIFNSLTFFVFFVLVVAVYYVLRSWTHRKLFLLLASYVFYAAWNPPFVLLLIGSTLIDWYVARLMGATAHPARRRALLYVSLAFNLGVLAFFKYGGFLLDNFVRLLGTLGVQYSPPAWGIVLPIGISFYTFLTLSYTIDVYKQHIEPNVTLLDYAFFITFFPHLVAGPIIRAADFLPQCRTPRLASRREFSWGLTLMALGLFEKVVLADALMAPVADQVYAAVGNVGFLDAWVGTLAFSAQIFFDFAGYSTCAIGAALCLGFVLKDNFRFPYAAVGFSDFWQRWHISLSTWLRDYLYIPLGGNRGDAWNTGRNLMLTMLIGGLWHGAAWRFVAWGGLHGTYLVVERVATPAFRHVAWLHTRLARFAIVIATFLLVCLTWTFFRAKDFSDAARILRAMVVGAPDRLSLGVGPVITVAAMTALLVGTHWWMRDSNLADRWQAVPWWGRAVALATMIMSIALVPGDDRAFIYFQF